MCRGTTTGMYCRASVTGLSPRVQGNREPRVRGRQSRGSIPACAGEPTLPESLSARLRVYPRVCRGTSSSPGVTNTSGGLSPRVQGNRALRRRPRAARGSIPACAGEPTVQGELHRIRTVYPRVCRGTAGRLDPPGCAQGLSPRVQGNRQLANSVQWLPRSIPACAGEPIRACSAWGLLGVYPRVCRGTEDRFVVRQNLKGLSPRVQGNQRPSVYLVRTAGSIPACAGEPARSRDSTASPRVYPRVCRGTHSCRPTRCCWAGLSPRVQGNL